MRKLTKEEYIARADRLSEAGVRYLLTQYIDSTYRETYPAIVKALEGAIEGDSPDTFGLMAGPTGERIHPPVFIEFTENCNPFQKKEIADWTIAHLILTKSLSVNTIWPYEWEELFTKDLATYLDYLRTSHTVLFFRGVSRTSRGDTNLLQFMADAVKLGVLCVCCGSKEDKSITHSSSIAFALNKDLFSRAEVVDV